MLEAAETQRLRALGADEAAAAVRDACIALPPPEKVQDFGAFFDRFADAKVVLLGEATHGTSEFYRARAAITRWLVEEHDFQVVAVEADWPDAVRIDRYVRHRGRGDHEEDAFVRFPAWMWRNEDVAAFTAWLRSHNERLPPARRTEFRGLDVYSMRASIASVLAYLDRVDPDAARRARGRYACLTPWQADPAWYGHVVTRGEADPCEDAVVAELRELLDRRLDYEAKDGEDFFDAAQNARTVHAAEQYYRTMYRGAAESWNLRDRHMFNTLRSVMDRRGPGTKAVVWAHNSHVGNAAATAMGWRGEFNIGELCRTAFGDAAVLVGFGTDRGTVAAADDWGGPMKIKSVVPARSDSYERVFRQSGVARSLTDLRDPRNGEVRAALAIPRLERAIGVVYRPETELYSHYFEAVLPEQFDAYVWFEQTRAVSPLAEGRPSGVPATYPFGL